MYQQKRGINETYLSIRKFVALFQRAAAGSGLHFLFEIQGYVGQFFLDVSHDFTFGCTRNITIYEEKKWPIKAEFVYSANPS